LRCACGREQQSLGVRDGDAGDKRTTHVLTLHAKPTRTASHRDDPLRSPVYDFAPLAVCPADDKNAVIAPSALRSLVRDAIAHWHLCCGLDVSDGPPTFNPPARSSAS